MKCLFTGLCLAAALAAHADTPLPFGTPGAAPLAPWHVAGLPRQKKPFTNFSIVDVDGRRAVRIEADNSYGNLVYPLNPARACVADELVVARRRADRRRRPAHQGPATTPR